MSKQRRIDTLEQFETYLETRPQRLGCWRDGKEGRYPLLAWLNVQPIVERRELVREVGPQAAAMLSAAVTHNQVGTAVGWVLSHMTGPRKTRAATEEDRLALLKTAGEHWAMRNALSEVRAGLRGFDTAGSLIRMPFLGNREIDALDRMLEVARDVGAFSKPSANEGRRAGAWLRTEGRSCPWSAAPIWVRDEFRTTARRALDSYARYLPDEVTVAGITVADIDELWVELLAWGMEMDAATLLGAVNPDVTAPRVPRSDLVEMLAHAAGLGQETAARFVDLLTADPTRCRDVALTPLVPVGSRDLLPMSSLIIPQSPHRNSISIVQADPGQFSRAGQLLGKAGEHAVETILERLDARVLVSRRVDVVRRDSTPAGDLDIVVCDTETSTGAIFEIKWHLGADGSAEVAKAEQAALSKRKQVVRLRDELRSGGASPRWPKDWPDVSDFSFRWFVLTNDVLVTREVDAEEVTIRSCQLLESMLKNGASLEELIRLLDDPPIPDFFTETQWERFRYGDIRIGKSVV